jgi:predicted PurR-regulated permease PerM
LLEHKFLRTCLCILAVLCIIYMTWKISFILAPLTIMFNLLIVPFTLSAFFYYLLRPIVHYLDTRKMNRTVSVLLIYFVIAGIIFIFIKLVWPTLQKQVTDFITNAPALVDDLKMRMNRFQQDHFVKTLFPDGSNVSSKMTDYLNKGVTMLSGYISGLFTFLTDFVIVIGTVPIVLFYLLKESGNVTPMFMKVIPRRYRRDGREVLIEIDDALGGYISGRMISTGLLAVMQLVGLIIIGLPYPLLLTLLSSILTFIPYVGALLGAIPCVIVAMTISPNMTLWTIVIIFVAQHVQDNVITPLIYGKKIDIHPLTTIIILLVAGDFAGILGMLLAIPVYMIAKIVIRRIYQLFLSEKIEELVD